MRSLSLVTLACFALGCGARTELDRSVPDGGTDAGPLRAERCDGLDDDGDGRIDEAIPELECGVGPCRARVPGCVEGQVPRCVPAPPSTEVCNAVDDDCDGAVDEELGLVPLGAPIVVRDVNDFGSELCSTCAIPFGPELVSTDAGLVAAWRLGFLGTSPEPNTFVRALDDRGEPTGSIELVLMRNTTQGLRGSTGPGGGALVYCGRDGSADRTMSVLIDPRGRPRSEASREPRNRSCGAWSPDVIHTGSRWLFAWTDNSTGPVPGFEVLLDVAAADGTNLEERMLEPEGASGPRFALGHGRVLLVVEARPEPRRSRIAVHRFDLDGRAAGEPVYIELPAGVDDAFVTPYAVPTADGFAVHAASARRDGGRFVAILGPDGALRADVRRLDEGVRYVNGFDDVSPRTGGGALIATPRQVGGEYGYAVLAVADDGRTTAAWIPEAMDAMGLAWGQLTEHRGRTFLIHTALLGENRGQVLVRTLGCAP
jgi:hypothetical protein